MTPKILPCGDSALSFQLGEDIDDETNARVIALAAALAIDRPRGILEIVPTYRSLLVQYDPEVIRGAALETLLLTRFSGLRQGRETGRRWSVPVVYGGQTGQDLEEIARLKGISPQEVMALHSGAEFRVYMIGFQPGFTYLGGLPEALHCPRLAQPRQSIAAGAVGIGGQQANINSVAGPSGWRYLGWTPLVSFDPAREDPFLFRAGDRICFRPVDMEEAKDLAARIATGKTVIVPEAGR
ncbi:MAG: 5-oxoprolinase subunit PxpB [Pseudorhodobacter sp.]